MKKIKYASLLSSDRYGFFNSEQRRKFLQQFESSNQLLLQHYFKHQKQLFSTKIDTSLAIINQNDIINLSTVEIDRLKQLFYPKIEFWE